MKKIKCTLVTAFLVAVVFFTGFGQSKSIPNGYYNSAEGLSGSNLKTALYNIIKGHTEYPYTATTTDVWDIIKESDRDPANSANVICIYSGLSVNAAQEYNNSNGWTREHVWAKIHGNFGTDAGAGTDLHHLRPEVNDVNEARNSRFFAECTTPYFYNGVNTGCFTSSTQWVWKPRQAVVGDIARMIFYMATRYEGENGEPNLEIIDYIPSVNNSTEPLFGKLSDLLAWNEQDPVDDFERNRNEVVYSYQHNRNPFIDHPEYVNQIWGGNASPVFANIVTNPSEPTESDAVIISADITDADGINTVSLKWGTTVDVYNNSISMNLVSGTTYTTATAIPAQPNGTSVYYKIEVTDQLSITASSAGYLYHLSNGNEGTAVTLFSDNFNDGTLNKWNVQSVIGAQSWTIHPTYGISGGPCARMTGYTTVNNANEDWLITPAVSLTGVPDGILTFYSACGYAGANIQVKYSTNYSGTGDPSVATWTDFTGYALSTSSFTWVPSGNVSLSGLSNQTIYVAFVYYSTTAASRIWELDDIAITGTFYDGDITPPQLQVQPVAGTTNLPLDQTISVSSTEPLFNPLLASVTAGYLQSVIQFTKGDEQGDDVPFTINLSENNTQFNITPNNLLEYSTNYFIALPGSSVGDESGNLVITGLATHFTTRAIPDITSPQITIVPANNDNNIPIEQVITLTANEALFTASQTNIDAAYLSGIIHVSLGNAQGTAVAFTPTISDTKTQIVVTPSSNLNYSTTYFISIDANSLSDASGNKIVNAITTQFTTIGQPDVTPPQISIIPANNSHDVPIDQQIQIISNEALFNTSSAHIDMAYLQTKLILKKNNQTGTDVAFGLRISSTFDTVTLIPTSSLDWQTTYYVGVLPASLSDGAGNVVSNINPVIFTTSKQPDQAPPDLLSCALGSDWKTIIFTFDEPLQDKTGHLKDSIVFSNDGQTYSGLGNADIVAINDTLLHIVFANTLTSSTNVIKIKGHCVADTLGNVIEETITSPVFDATGSDTRAPLFLAGYPMNDSITAITAYLKFAIDEPGKVFYTVKKKSDVAPTKAQVLAGPYLAIAEANMEYFVKIEQLTDYTAYVIYLLTQDNHTVVNTSAYLSKLNFTTLAVTPVITLKTIETEKCPGDNAELSVEATGTSPIVYTWYFNNQAINLSNLPTLTLNNVNAEIAGAYYCVAENIAGTDTSETGTLMVLPLTTAGADNAVTLKDTTPSFDLSTLLSEGATTGGTWLETTTSGTLQGSVLNPAITGTGIFEFIYQTTGSCNTDEAVFTVTIEATEGIYESKLIGIRIWPNPSKGEIHLEAKETINVAMIIYQYDGKIIESKTNIKLDEAGFLLNLHHQGVYFIQMISNGVSETRKIVIE